VIKNENEKMIIRDIFIQSYFGEFSPITESLIYYDLQINTPPPSPVRYNGTTNTIVGGANDIVIFGGTNNTIVGGANNIVIWEGIYNSWRSK